MAPVLAILLDHNDNVYQAGETMTGRIVYQNQEEVTCRGVYVRFKGAALVHWTETRSSGKNTYTVCYNNDERYFDQKVFVYPQVPHAGGDNPVIPPGSHEWRFTFTLPTTIPSSFEGEHGKVRYQAEVVVDRPWKFDHSTSVYFTVLSLYNLNNDARSMMPTSATDTKHRCCLCCKSGPITGEVSVDRTGYVPGETLVARAISSNGTSGELEKVKLNLHKSTVFHARSKSRTRTSIIASIEKEGGLRPGQEDQWIGAQIPIPALPPSDLVGCSIIDIHYSVQLEIVLPMPSINLRVHAPIIIGTIPHQQVVQMYQNPSAYAAPPGALQPTAPPAGQDPMAPPPPVYSNAAGGAPGDDQAASEAGSDDEEGAEAFTPKYTFYDWSQYSQPPPTAYAS